MNRFSKRTRKWMNGKFFLEKFNNFNGCLLIVLVPMPQPLMFTVLQDDSENFHFFGYGTKIHDIIRSKFNYTFFLTPRLGVDKGNATLIEDFWLSSMPMRQGFILDAKIITTDRITTKDVIILTSRSYLTSSLTKYSCPLTLKFGFGWLNIHNRSFRHSCCQIYVENSTKLHVWIQSSNSVFEFGVNEFQKFLKGEHSNLRLLKFFYNRTVWWRTIYTSKKKFFTVFLDDLYLVLFDHESSLSRNAI